MEDGRSRTCLVIFAVAMLVIGLLSWFLSRVLSFGPA